jgi:hypothetical protein
MTKIAIDCDGVLTNFIKAFVEEANHIWPGRFPNPLHYSLHNHTAWDFSDAVMGPDEVKQVWRRINGSFNWWLTLDAFTENVGALAVFLWTHKFNDIFIVTARQETLGASVAGQTDLWIRACGVDPVHNYLGVVPIEGDDKAAFYQLSGIRWSVDDKGSTVEQCDAMMPDRHHRAFLLDRPWNQDAKVKRRVKNLSEFFAQVV